VIGEAAEVAAAVAAVAGAAAGVVGRPGPGCRGVSGGSIVVGVVVVVVVGVVVVSGQRVSSAHGGVWSRGRGRVGGGRGGGVAGVAGRGCGLVPLADAGRGDRVGGGEAGAAVVAAREAEACDPQAKEARSRCGWVGRVGVTRRGYRDRVAAGAIAREEGSRGRRVEHARRDACRPSAGLGYGRRSCDRCWLGGGWGSGGLGASPATTAASRRVSVPATARRTTTSQGTSTTDPSTTMTPTTTGEPAGTDRAPTSTTVTRRPTTRRDGARPTSSPGSRADDDDRVEHRRRLDDRRGLRGAGAAERVRRRRRRGPVPRARARLCGGAGEHAADHEVGVQASNTVRRTRWPAGSARRRTRTMPGQAAVRPREGEKLLIVSTGQVGARRRGGADRGPAAVRQRQQLQPRQPERAARADEPAGRQQRRQGRDAVP
jgi:hypothetical protein